MEESYGRGCCSAVSSSGSRRHQLVISSSPPPTTRVIVIKHAQTNTPSCVDNTRETVAREVYPCRASPVNPPPSRFVQYIMMSKKHLSIQARRYYAIGKFEMCMMLRSECFFFFLASDPNSTARRNLIINNIVLLTLRRNGCVYAVRNLFMLFLLSEVVTAGGECTENAATSAICNNSPVTKRRVFSGYVVDDCSPYYILRKRIIHNSFDRCILCTFCIL